MSGAVRPVLLMPLPSLGRSFLGDRKAGGVGDRGSQCQFSDPTALKTKQNKSQASERRGREATQKLPTVAWDGLPPRSRLLLSPLPIKMRQDLQPIKGSFTGPGTQGVPLKPEGSSSRGQAPPVLVTSSSPESRHLVTHARPYKQEAGGWDWAGWGQRSGFSGLIIVAKRLMILGKPLPLLGLGPPLKGEGGWCGRTKALQL